MSALEALRATSAGLHSVAEDCTNSEMAIQMGKAAIRLDLAIRDVVRLRAEALDACSFLSGIYRSDRAIPLRDAAHAIAGPLELP